MIYWHCNLPFSNGDKALINDVHQFKKYSFQTMLVVILKTNCKREKLGMLITKIWGKRSTTKGMRLAGQSMLVLKRM